MEATLAFLSNRTYGFEWTKSCMVVLEPIYSSVEFGECVLISESGSIYPMSVNVST